MRGLSFALVVLVPLLAGPQASNALAADTPAAAQAADPCLTNTCRPADAWVVFIDTDGQKKKANAGKLAYTNTEMGTVTVLLGETLKLNAESNGKVVDKVTFAEVAKAADADPAPLGATVKKGAGQIVLQYAQTKEPKTNSRLVVTHNFEGTLVFDAYVQPIGKPYTLSPSCPVPEGTSVSTTWYVPVPALSLANFRLVEKAEPVTASEIVCQ